MPRQIEKAPQIGRKNMYVKLSFNPLVFISCLVFKNPVQKFEKYIIPIKP